MSDLPSYRSCILDEGKYAIGKSLVQKKRLQPHSFVVGTEYNFEPNEDATTIRGEKVFTGTQSLISGAVLSKDTFRFSLTFPESSGPFTIGNILLYVQTDDGLVFPFIWVSLKIPYPKQEQKSGSIGNRYVFEFVEKIVNVKDALNITVQASEFFSLAGFVNEETLPTPDLTLFQQFVVQEPRYSPVPFLGMRRSIDNTLWGMPLPFRVSSPFFGLFDGGRAGEPLFSKVETFYGGAPASMKDVPVTYGGTPVGETSDIFIGGEPIPDNPGYSYP